MSDPVKNHGRNHRKGGPDAIPGIGGEIEWEDVGSNAPGVPYVPEEDGCSALFQSMLANPNNGQPFNWGNPPVPYDGPILSSVADPTKLFFKKAGAYVITAQVMAQFGMQIGGMIGVGISVATANGTRVISANNHGIQSNSAVAPFASGPDPPQFSISMAVIVDTTAWIMAHGFNRSNAPIDVRVQPLWVVRMVPA